MSNKILVLGAGSWGTALAIQLAQNKDNKVTLWSWKVEHCQKMIDEGNNHQFLPDCPFPKNLSVCLDWRKVIDQVDDVLIGVPSSAFENTIQEISNGLKHQGVIWATKGFCHDSYKFLHEIAQQYVPKTTPLAIITGPSFAKEVAKHLPTAVVIAGSNERFNQKMQQAFTSDNFRVYITDDLIGAQVGGALKNAMAIATGISDGLGFGANARVGLITRGMVELKKLGHVLGAKPETLMGLSGLGDLILTCTDNQSRNRQFGLQMGAGLSMNEALKSIGQVVEGIPTAKSIYHLAKHHHIELPIVEQVYNVLFNQLNPKQAVKNLMSRVPKAEKI